MPFWLASPPVEANHGPTEATNGVIKLRRRLAHGYRSRDTY